jgi:Protein of unknown function (DUF2852)
MEVLAKLDDIGKPAWLALMVLAFIVFWPLGLAMLAFLIWSGRMGCWKRGAGRGPGRWYHYGDGSRSRGSSGNSAFDEYREETLRRLEEEQAEFHNFLDRLRQAKDKAEFDQFMAERRRQGGGRPAGEAGPAAEPAG